MCLVKISIFFVGPTRSIHTVKSYRECIQALYYIIQHNNASKIQRKQMVITIKYKVSSKSDC